MTKLRSREAYEEAIRNSLSIAQVCRYLHIKPVGGNYRTIHQAIDLYNIDTSHFTGQGWNSGERYSPVVKKFPLSRILVNPSRYNSNNLKRRLLSENIKEYRCERCGRCGLSEWQGQKIPLELHHKDGNNSNNEIGNLQLLCPNCHALTDNYRGKNKMV